MSSYISLSVCPACDSPSVYPALSAKDYTVSGERFEIWHCDDCTLRFTQNCPNTDSIGQYYQSDNYVSHSDTAKGFINQLYHIIRNYTLRSKRLLVQKVTQQKTGTLLEIGAGTGAFSNMMKKSGWQLTALEPDSVARQNALKIHGLHLEPAENLFHLAAGTYDAITLWHVMEHVHSLKEYWKEFARILNPAGKLIIAVPNYTSYDAKKYGEFWAAYDVPRHLYHFSPKSMDLLGLQMGYKLIEVKPMWFDSFYVSMLSEQYKNGSGNIVGAIWNGLLSNVKSIGNKKKCSSVIYIFSKK